MTMTIKELADEIGVSKQAIQKRINNLPTNQQPTLVGGRYILNHELVEKIKGMYRESADGEASEIRQHSDNDQQPTDNYLLSVIDDLKKDKKELFSSMIAKDSQLSELQKLLDQQQQLTLQANKKIEQLETSQQDKEILPKKEVPDLEEVKTGVPPKKSFWKRLFP